MIDLSEKLLELREHMGVTQIELGEVLGTSFKIVSKWEQGEYVPNIHELMEIADFYDIPFEEFVELEKISDDFHLERKEFIQKTNNKYFLKIKWLVPKLLLAFYVIILLLIFI